MHAHIHTSLRLIQNIRITFLSDIDAGNAINFEEARPILEKTNAENVHIIP